MLTHFYLLVTIQKVDRVFSIFGKLVLIFLVIGILLAGGYYLGKKYTLFQQVPNQTSTSPVPTSTSSATISTTPAKTASNRVEVDSGGVSTFEAYKLSAFSDWIVTKTHDTGAGIDKVVIAKADYSVTISQGPMGGAKCIFPGEAPQDFSTQLTTPVAQIPLLNGKILKRGQANNQTNPGKETDTVCEQDGSDNAYSTFTEFGAITYVTPINRDNDTIAQMDAMVGSLQKQ